MRALVAGVAVHAIAALVAHVALPRRSALAIVRPVESWSVELIENQQAEQPPPSHTPEASALSALPVESRAAQRSAASSRSTESVGAPSPILDALEPSEEATAITPTIEQPQAARPPIDLGLNGRFALLPAPDRAPPSRVERAQQRLDAALAEDRVKRGQGRGVALIGSLSSAARAAGPTRGSAVLRVTLDANGNVSTVALVSGSGGEWSGVLRALREQAKAKRIALPSGARGLALTFRVTSRLARPSGKGEHAGAVETEKPSLAPDGLTLRGGFDVGDVAGALQRLVTSELLSEEVL